MWAPLPFSNPFPMQIKNDRACVNKPSLPSFDVLRTCQYWLASGLDSRGTQNSRARGSPLLTPEALWTPRAAELLGPGVRSLNSSGTIGSQDTRIRRPAVPCISSLSIVSSQPSPDSRATIFRYLLLRHAGTQSVQGSENSGFIGSQGRQDSRDRSSI